MTFIRRQTYWVVAGLVLFTALYSSVSLVNHFNFRTYALDLGLYTNAMWDYAHLQFNDSSLFKSVAENLLADHFDLYLILFSPLIFIFGSTTLLVVQIVATMIGAIGIYRYAIKSTQEPSLALLAMFQFLCFYGVWSAVAFDYHSNVVAACVVPWLFSAFNEGRWRQFGFLLLFILIGKENMSLWMCFVMAALAMAHWRTKAMRSAALLGMAVSALYFATITGLVMPLLSAKGQYAHFDYSHLGKDPISFLVYLFSNPVESLSMLFANHTGVADGDWVKVELHAFVLISGGWLLIRKPQYLFMLIPIYAQKLFHDNAAMWSILGQYNIEFAPILAIGTVEVAKAAKSRVWQRLIIAAALLGSGLCTFRMMDSTIVASDKSRIRFYQARHYTRNYPTEKVREALSLIPSSASVSAQSPFVPHLVMRDRLYQFPLIKDAQFVLLSTNEAIYPLSETEYETMVRTFFESEAWIPKFNEAGVLLFERVD